MRVVLLLGTKKGLFLAESDARRADWHVCGPLTSGTWSFYSVAVAPEEGRTALYGGGASNWYGPAVWKSTDWGETWTHSSEGLRYADGDVDVSQVWCLTPAHGALYAGVEPAGLFKSTDGGASWAEVGALRGHPSAAAWRPSNGGLSLHSLAAHPAHAHLLWAAISAGGTLRSMDGGQTWESDLAAAPHPCVHALALAGGGAGSGGHQQDARLYQQHHTGVGRSDDGGRTWRDVTPGLPSGFGFPLAVHPRDPETLYVVPLGSEQEGRRHVPGGRMAVWRSRDGGQSWSALTAGLPQERAFLSVLRGALATDTLEPAGVYAGTTTGQLYCSTDEGETWQALPARLPPVYAITAAAVEDGLHRRPP